MTDDIIAAFMRRLLTEFPETSADRARRIEDNLRRDFGGERHYARKAPDEGKAYRLGNALAAGESLFQAFADAEVSRRHGYRLLKRQYR